MRYLSDDLIAAIKRNASIPTSQNKFSNADFLAFLNEELTMTIMSELVETNQDYFITKVTIPLVASTSEYDFPTSAMGWKVETIGYQDTGGNYTKLDKINRSQRGFYGHLSDGGTPAAFYVEGNKVVMVPDVGASAVGSIVFDYVRVQNQLVMSASCGLISNVVVVGNDYQMTVNTLPSVSNGVDVIGGTNPFQVLAREKTAVVVGLTITVSMSDFERAPVVGDFVTAKGQTPVPNLPEDFHPVLAQAATIRCLISLNDAKGMQTAQASLGNMFDKMRARARRRVSSSPTKIVGRSHIFNLMRGR